jgi:hypothetical protein
MQPHPLIVVYAANVQASPLLLITIGIGVCVLAMLAVYQRRQAAGAIETATRTLSGASRDGTSVVGTWNGRTIKLTRGPSIAPGGVSSYILQTPIQNYGLRLLDRRLKAGKSKGHMLGDFHARYEVLDDGGEPLNHDVRAAAYEVQLAASLHAAQGHANLEIPLYNWSQAHLSAYFDQLDRFADAIDRSQRSLTERVLDPDADADSRLAWFHEVAGGPHVTEICQKLLASPHDEPHALLYEAAMHLGDIEVLGALLGSEQLAVGRIDPLIPLVADVAPAAAIHGLSFSPHPRMWARALELATTDELLRGALVLTEKYLQTNTSDGAVFAQRIAESSLPEAPDTLRNLALASNTDTAITAVIGLGALGSVADIAGLRARQRGASATPSLSAAIEATIDAIQQRSGGSAGAVSIANTNTGGVSIVEDG